MLQAGPHAPESDVLTDVEGDIRRLMRELAEARALRDQDAKAHDADLTKLYLAILGAADALDRVFLSVANKEELVTPQMKKWLGNFRTVRSLIGQLLADRGIQRIQNLDAGFDPRWHRATDVVNDPSRPEGTIAAELQAGYLWRNQVLRKAEVSVVRHDGDGAGESSE